MLLCHSSHSSRGNTHKSCSNCFCMWTAGLTPAHTQQSVLHAERRDCNLSWRLWKTTRIIAVISISHRMHRRDVTSPFFQTTHASSLQAAANRINMSRLYPTRNKTTKPDKNMNVKTNRALSVSIHDESIHLYQNTFDYTSRLETCIRVVHW